MQTSRQPKAGPRAPGKCLFRVRQILAGTGAAAGREHSCLTPALTFPASPSPEATCSPSPHWQPAFWAPQPTPPTPRDLRHGEGQSSSPREMAGTPEYPIPSLPESPPAPIIPGMPAPPFP